mmetsp:Transcript_7951/g.17173  ORF Transcript_7951/g.17173 Transcript_7951/m.17173 type:complete len:427 (+) Transcript_7951:83-1363(+)
MEPGQQTDVEMPQDSGSAEGETTPLLPYGARYSKQFFDDLPDDKKQRSVHMLDTMTYDGHQMIGWHTFLMTEGTVWMDKRLWTLVGRLLLLSWFVGLVTFFCAFDPNNLKVREFRQLATYLNVFVAFLLGLFMSIALNRWLACVNGFLVLVQAVRNLQIQLYSLGVPKDRVQHVLRYGVVSVRCLQHQLKGQRVFDEEKRKAFETEMWHELTTVGDEFSIMHEEEAEQLKEVEDPAGLLWLWVGSLIGRLAQDGLIPGMPTPTYGRIMNLAQQAQEGLREVRVTVAVQTPFMYVHTLSTVVHINNILAALSLGMTVGASLGVLLMATHHHLYPASAAPDRPVSLALENMSIATITCFVGPLLYQAFLIIGISISAPFSTVDGAKSHAEASIPVTRILKELHTDLVDGARMAAALPSWEPPCFKPKS